jgi:hypothetical protein
MGPLVDPMTPDNVIVGDTDSATSPRKLSPEAERALKEAEERRRKANAEPRPVEVGGRAGPDPVRFGDWENRGIAADF